MALIDELDRVLQKPDKDTDEFKAVLIPSRSIAQLLSAFANGKGGYLVFGVAELPSGQLDVRGFSRDFDVTTMVQKALELLNPRPQFEFTYFSYRTKVLFGLKVERSETPVFAEGKEYMRENGKTVERNAVVIHFKISHYPRFRVSSEQLVKATQGGTAAKSKLLDHYLAVLKLYEEAEAKIFPGGAAVPTVSAEGKILNRILFSSCVDNFEGYLSDLLYEIYLAKPDTLRGGEAKVRVSDVLDCADRDEFIRFYAGQKIRRLQKGSVKGFIAENKEIAQLQAVSQADIDAIERVLQIRHLYTHRNGIVDESFAAYFPGVYALNSEHVLSMDQVFDHLIFLAQIVNRIDASAIGKYLLAAL
jgi:hypothetical protein